MELCGGRRAGCGEPRFPRGRCGSKTGARGDQTDGNPASGSALPTLGRNGSCLWTRNGRLQGLVRSVSVEPCWACWLALLALWRGTPRREISLSSPQTCITVWTLTPQGKGVITLRSS